MTSLPPLPPMVQMAKAELEASVRASMLEYLNEPREEIIEDIIWAAQVYSRVVKEFEQHRHEEELARVFLLRS